MKIFVAGAAGVVGQLLLPLLSEAGHEVMGMTRSAAKLKQIEQSGAAAVVADVYDRDRLFELLADYRPDVVACDWTAGNAGYEHAKAAYPESDYMAAIKKFAESR